MKHIYVCLLFFSSLVSFHSSDRCQNIQLLFFFQIHYAFYIQSTFRLSSWIYFHSEFGFFFLFSLPFSFSVSFSYFCMRMYVFSCNLFFFVVVNKTVFGRAFFVVVVCYMVSELWCWCFVEENLHTNEKCRWVSRLCGELDSRFHMVLCVVFLDFWCICSVLYWPQLWNYIVQTAQMFGSDGRRLGNVLHFC